MEKFVTYTGLVAPLDRQNVDTDMNHPEAVLEVDQADRFRSERFRPPALPRRRPAGSGQFEASAQSRFGLLHIKRMVSLPLGQMAHVVFPLLDP